MRLLKKPNIFYGWWMILVADILAIYSGGVWFYGFSVFIKPISDEFGWSRAAISAGFSLARLEAAGTGIPAGYLVDKYGPRNVMLIGITLTGIGLLLFSTIQNLWSFYAIFVFIALGYGFGFFVPMATSVANWFDKKIGTAMGLFQAGYALCGIVPPITVFLINSYGWRHAVLVLGASILVFCLPLSLLIRHRPEKYGLLPDGQKPLAADITPDREALTSRLPPHDAREFTMPEALKTSSFWLISLAFGIASFGHNAVLIHTAPYFISLGTTEEVAALGLSIVIFSSFAGRLGFGWLADFIPKRYVMAICFAIELVSLIVFAQSSALWLLFLSLAVFGPAYGGTMPLRVAIQRDYFGRKGYGAIQGMMLMLATVPGALGPIYAGWVFDLTGGYREAFLFSSLAYLIAIALILFARPTQKHRQF